METSSKKTPAGTVTITLGSSTTTSRKWNIKVSQIPCHVNYKAPTDCRQYFTGAANSFNSFGFGTSSMSCMFRQFWICLQKYICFIFSVGQLYAICIRQEYGFCSIQYTAKSSSIPSVKLEGSTTASTLAKVPFQKSKDGFLNFSIISAVLSF